MREFDIYLPTTLQDGAPIDPELIREIKSTLVNAFGGYTHFTHRNEGAWRIGNVTFRDEITVIRVLDDGRAHFDMVDFKRQLERRLQQSSILIVARTVHAI